MTRFCMFSGSIYSKLPLNNKRIHAFVSRARKNYSNGMKVVKSANLSPSNKPSNTTFLSKFHMSY